MVAKNPIDGINTSGAYVPRYLPTYSSYLPRYSEFGMIFPPAEDNNSTSNHIDFIEYSISPVS